jgi:predicted Zn-ribbon and HTH transcriptional regulator
MKEKKQQNICICMRCGYEWVAKVKKPKVCAECKSPYYDKEYTKKGFPK